MSATIRHLGTAVGLLIGGAEAAAEYGPEMTAEEYRIQILLAVVREVADHMESDDTATVRRVASNLTFRLDQDAEEARAATA